MKNLPLLFLLLIFFQSIFAQTFNRFDVPVIVDDTPLLNPWAGGLNAPQWSAADLNNDGKPDLYAFDRNGEVHLTWLNVGAAGESKYQFAPEFADPFPRCVHFVLLRDYNRDGAMDLFTHGFIEGLPAFRVFKGKFENNHLAFDRVEFPQYFADVITIPVAGSFTNLPVNPPDYPAIDDLDGDGDLDILVLSQSLQNLAYYENKAIEKGFTDDTLIYELKDPCWGSIYLAPFAQSFTLSENGDCECPEGLLSSVNLERGGGVHGSAALLTFDDDNDGDKEILFGDLIFPHIIYGKNGGDPEEACIASQDTTYPKYDAPVDLPNFPATFYLDLDNDGLNDLMASPNIAKNAHDQLVGWFYKNIQTNEFPKFELQQKDLIVKDMLDLGTGAQPAFVDYNADGLMDLAVGNINFFTSDAPMMLVPEEPRLYLLQNTGTASEPKFELVDDDWLNFSQFAGFANAFAPAFGDLDSDGDLDLLVGEDHGTLFFVENLAGAGNSFNFGVIQSLWQSIDVGLNATPFIHDMNKDGLPDLVVGERNGNVNYLPNTGTPGNPIFHPNPDEAPNNKFFGCISTQQPGFVTGYSAPVVLEFDSKTYVATGSELGYLELYLVNFDSLNSGCFELVTPQFGDVRTGFVTRPAFALLNDDAFFETVIGNCRGGLDCFRTHLDTLGVLPAGEVKPKLGVKIYPNPAGDFLTVEVENEAVAKGEFRIFNSLGQVVFAGKTEGKTTRLDVSGWLAGVYFIEIKVKGGIATSRFLLAKS